MTVTHHIVSGRTRRERESVIASLHAPPPLIPPVDAHARLRGPFTAGGSIVRALVPRLLRAAPELVRAHDLEIRWVAPELRPLVPPTRETLFERIPLADRTRIHSRFRSARVSHGLADLLRDLPADGSPRSLVVENTHAADPTDRELLEILLRRLDPARLTLVLAGAVPFPAGRAPVTAHAAAPSREPAAVRLGGRAHGADGASGAHAADGTLGTGGADGSAGVEGGAASGDEASPGPADGAGGVPAPSGGVWAVPSGRGPRPGDREATREPARRAVAADLTEDDLTEDDFTGDDLTGDGLTGDVTGDGGLAALRALDEKERAALHDARADELAAGEWTWRLGAIPWHRWHGSDPVAAVEALLVAQEHCYAHAFHDACLEFGLRGRELAAYGGADWWRFTKRAALSLTMLGRTREAEELYTEAREASDDPAVHHVAGYEIAMLYARHHEPGRHDYARATAEVNAAIAIASLLPDPHDRAFHEVFYRNGRALIQMRRGDAEGALRAVEEGIARMDAALPPGRHDLDRCTLLSNRARLLTMLGRPEEAVAAYDALLAVDPDYAEYHFDRAGLLHRLGRHAEALAGYDEAVRLGPPFPEMHHNRALLRQALGDEEGALADLGRVLELDPGYVDAYVNRAGLRAAAGDRAGAAADIAEGLSLDPGNPYLICVCAQLAADAGDRAAARADFDRALAAAPDLVAALAGRAALSLDEGDPEAAVADLTRALAVAEDAALLYNRAVAHRAAGRPAAARADLARARELAPDDPDVPALLAALDA
ncbi:tetratricopeptide repeat protein [Bailinhaonella thermotolerans]|uniref:Tetratricopeptide repeat protein n=1 Tax=Bailinhaonella thermotolerans TaxID=1070861 RepID=A0A3A4B009_9ACTN|nr:tetratricopeptide repeat protein [Bailinhaonella thermotolerans]RJL33258.1 hypothetical protein D5H75_10560 [Bailinhaonella thermotolerans]